MNRKYFIWILFVVLAFASTDVVSQDFVQKDPGEVTNDAKREEIQRYFGYELLLYRYLSLPYDVSVNVNQQANSVDIGIIYILFIPILFLLLLSKRRWIQILTIVYLIFTWSISTSNAFIYSFSKNNVAVNPGSIRSYLKNVSFSDEPFTHMLAWIYQLSLTLYKPLGALGNAVSGDSDYVTYPLIFTAFILISLFLSNFIESFKTKKKLFVAFFWSYSFYWFAFSGGIPWYGNILFLLGLFMIPLLSERLSETSPVESRIINKAFIILGCVWIFFAMALRTSDIQPMMDRKFFAKGVFNPVYYDYATGKIDIDKSLDIIYPEISKAFKKINDDKKAYVLRIGTSFNYFIDNNNQRVVMDNQLGLFHELYKRYTGKLELVDVLKSSGFKYIILDLNTATIDFTPDKSLTSKYAEVLNFAINNPYLKLLATDRVVGNKGANGQMVYTRNIYGEHIEVFGRYAIFEIV